MAGSAKGVQMICYKDRVFCPYYLLCKHGHGCEKALTPEVEKAAEKWWGSPEAPIDMYGSFPSCFIPFFDNSLGGDLGDAS